MRLVILTLIVIEFCLSCTFPVPRRYKEDFGCFEEKYTGLDTLINIKGFYSKMEIHDHRDWYGMKNGKYQRIGSDTTYHNVIFFSNGFFTADVWAPELLNNNKIIGQCDGIYSIHGDTIKAKCLNSGRLNNSWGGHEEWYKIIDKTTISNFYWNPIGVTWTDKSKELYQAKTFDKVNPSRFVSVDSLPTFKSWLKNEKWFFCKPSSK